MTGELRQQRKPHLGLRLQEKLGGGEGGEGLRREAREARLLEERDWRTESSMGPPPISPPGLLAFGAEKSDQIFVWNLLLLSAV